MSTSSRRWIIGLAAGVVALGAVVGLSARGAHAANADLPFAKDQGGGAPEKVLIDNKALRVTLISFPAGFHREGNERRPYDTLIAYVEEGDFKVAPRAGARRPNPNAAARFRRPIGQPAKCDAVKDCGPVGPDGNYEGQPLAVGTVTYHPKGSVTPTITVGHAYRALYIELKK